ncbi:MAG: transposase [Microgenomates group bacterium]
MKRFKEGQIFHVFNKSIANYPIFKDLKNSERFIKVLDYYNNQSIDWSLSRYLIINKEDFLPKLLTEKNGALLKFLAYCIMPDHYHILVKVLKDNILSKYINDVENSFTRFFNIKFKRKGPLWESRFKAVLIRTDNQLLHVTRYIHLNPTSSSLVDSPKDWIFSSFNDYLDKDILKNYLKEISIDEPLLYQKFCEDNIDYQRKLKKIKKLIFD